MTIKSDFRWFSGTLGALLVATALGAGCGAAAEEEAPEAGEGAANARTVGGVDLAQACRVQHGASAVLELTQPPSAFAWKGRVGSDLRGIDVDAACTSQYGVTGKSRYRNASDPYSWECFLPSVTLYANDDFGGGSFDMLRVHGDQPTLGGVGWNGIASSIRLDEVAVNVYSDVNYGGTCQTIFTSMSRLGPQPIGNDRIRSIRFAPSNLARPLSRSWDNDGCSGPGLQRDKDRFFPACVGHDRCYATLGKPKSTCDNEFYAAMFPICDRFPLGSTDRSDCFIAREAFYTGVVVGGQPAYNNGQAASNGYGMLTDHGEQFWLRQTCATF